jgi:hypothetical protein
MSEKKRIMQVGGVVTLATMIALLATPAMAMTKDEALKHVAEEEAACKRSGGYADEAIWNSDLKKDSWGYRVHCNLP